MAPAAILDEIYDTSTTKQHLSSYDSDSQGGGNIDQTGSIDAYSSAASQNIIVTAMEQHVDAIDPFDCPNGEDEAFFVADLGEIYRQHTRWNQLLPRVKPHFAVKCNPDPNVLKLLHRLGIGFDCASKQEIEQVLALGVTPDRIIYAQPCKANSSLQYAAKHGVRQMTFDNVEELYKIRKMCPNAELLLRITTDDSASLCQLSQKYGVDVGSSRRLLAVAKNLELNVVGVAFHCGSGASDVSAFVRAVYHARQVFDHAKSLGLNFRILDCGGGFMANTFDRVATTLGLALDQCFDGSVEIIAEPGRFYTSTAFTLACNVIARRTAAEDSLKDIDRRLYINDGIYGNLSCIMYDHQRPKAKRLSRVQQSCPTTDDSLIRYSIWGPTCDGIDRIDEEWFSDQPVEIGDWVYFENMGAYTKCSATRFNGFTNEHKTIYTSSEPSVMALIGAK